VSVTLAIDGWAPSLGTAAGADDVLPTAPGEVDVSVERPADRWAPLRPPPCEDAPVCFVDGVRRVDGVLWRSEGSAEVRQALAVSIAAGSVRCDGPSAVVEVAEVQRLLIGPAGFAPLETRAGTYEPRAVADDDPDVLRRGTQERLRRLERRIIDRALGTRPEELSLLVLDGPLDGSVEVPQAVGYVKTHHVAYLPEEVRPVVADLTPGERTPLFLAQSSWTRYSWYQRLPYGSGHPWAGIVRCEASADLDAGAAAGLADRCAASLPRFASRPHKDARAPQNLYPIGGLERHLKRLLGDHGHVLRCLRDAVRGPGPVRRGAAERP
jgi:hypothetical protein